MLGRRLDDEIAGATAAGLLACSPNFLYQNVPPMSDVPATALWLVVAIACIRDDDRGAVAAGIAASLAILTRPDLVLAIVALLLMARTRACAVGGDTQQFRQRFPVSGMGGEIAGNRRS